MCLIYVAMLEAHQVALMDVILRLDFQRSLLKARQVAPLYHFEVRMSIKTTGKPEHHTNYFKPHNEGLMTIPMITTIIKLPFNGNATYH